MPGDTLNFHSSGFLSLFPAPEFSDQLEVFLVVDVHLPVLVVLELWMLVHFLRYFFASETPDALNLKRRFISEDATSCECVFSEMIESLQESFHQVLSLVKDLSFVAVLLVLQEPETVSFCIELLLQCLHATTLLVLVVDHQRLEVEEVPWAWWQSFKWIDCLLLRCGLLFFRLCSLNFLRFFLWFNLLRLDGKLVGWLERFLAKLDLTEGSNE